MEARLSSSKRRRLRAKSAGVPPAELKTYKMIFFRRTDTCGSSIMQVPDAMRVVTEGSIKTQCNHKIRRIVKQELKQRGADACLIHHNRLLTRKEVLDCLVEATPAKERLDDMSLAGNLEMTHTLQQGINHRSLHTWDVYMTLKQLFLFSWKFDWSDTERRQYWGGIIELAVRGGVGLHVNDIFAGQQRRAEAVEWMMGFDRTQSFSETARIFSPPRVLNEPNGGIILPAEVGGTEQAEVGTDEWGLSDGDDLNEVNVAGTEQYAVFGVEQDTLEELIKKLKQYQESEGVIDHVRSLCRRRKSPRLLPLATGSSRPPCDHFKYDTGVLAECLRILSDRRFFDAYGTDVKKNLTEPSSYDDEEDAIVSKNADPANPIKEHVAALADQGKESLEMAQFNELGFFVTRCMPFWYVCLLEALALMHARTFISLFLKESTKDHERWDPKRKVCYIVKKDLLFKLVTEPIVGRMRGLGLLNVVGEEVLREADACSALKSFARPPGKPVPQGMHADTPPSYDWKGRFGFSSITAGSKPAVVEIYAQSYDGGRGSKGVRVRVVLAPGETLVFNGLARHRGTSYTFDNLRFFVSIVVKEASDHSKTSTFETANELEEFAGSDEGDTVSLDEWRSLPYL